MWQRAGVRVRSTVAATALLAVLVVAGGVVGLTLLRQALYSVEEETGGVQARLVRLSVTASALEGGDAALASAVGADADRGSHIQVLTQDGTVVAASAALAGAPALSSLRPQVTRLEREVVDLPELGRASPWVVSVLGGEVEDRRFWVVVAESTGDASRVLTVATALLAVATPVLLAAIAAATWTFVGRSLRPVEAIRVTVRGITARGLDGRVPVPAGDDEVSRLAVTMNEMLARLEAAQVSQRRFVADASHELRSPVATLRAAAEVWAREGAVPVEFTALVGSESGRLQSLVADLLVLARADEGQVLARVEEVDLDEVVEVEVVRLRTLAGHASGQGSVQESGQGSGSVQVRAVIEPVRVLGDGAALARAVRNLTDNAVRHAGSVVEVRLAQVGGFAVVTVADDGPGIPVQERARVLERFVRLDASRQRGSGGTGLGLAIVAEVVGAHGGSVEVGQRAGGGAQLVLRIPLEGAQPPSAASR